MTSRNHDLLVYICRWTARIIGTLVFLLITAITIGESDGFPNPWKQPPAVRVEFLAMAIMWLGLILAWRWEGVGGAMILGGFSLFWIAEGRLPPLSLAFTPLLLAGLLYAMAWWGAGGGNEVRTWFGLPATGRRE